MERMVGGGAGVILGEGWGEGKEEKGEERGERESTSTQDPLL